VKDVVEKTIIIRDPVHEYIRVSPEEIKIIDHPLVQRLRWISQLSGAQFVFPSAVHTRLAHVLGTMHLSGLYAERIFEDDDEKKHKIQVARLAGLLHDVGHGPFSHQFDDSVYKHVYPGKKHGHDIHRNKIVTESPLKDVISETGVEPNELINVWKGKNQIMLSIVQGTLGADRMDFLVRDSYFAGTSQFGQLPIYRIIHHASIQDHEGIPALHYNVKILDDIYQALLGRFFQYKGLYFHKASRAADLLITNMLSEAAIPLGLPDKVKDWDEFSRLNEYTLIGTIMSSNNGSIKKAKEICNRLLIRDLPKLVWEQILEEDTIDYISHNLEEGAKQIAYNKFIRKIERIARQKQEEMPKTYIDFTYPMSTINPREFNATKTFIWDPHNKIDDYKKSLRIEDALKKTRYVGTQGGVNLTDRFLILRVYVDAKDRNKINLWLEEEEKNLTEKNDDDTEITSY